MTRTANRTSVAEIAVAEGLTFEQWNRQPKYIRDIIESLVRQRDDATSHAAKLSEAQDPTCQWQGWYRGHGLRYLPEDTIHFGDATGSRLMHVRWDAGDQQLEVYGAGGAVNIEPRAANHFIVSLRDY